MKVNYFRASTALVALSALLCLGYAGSNVCAQTPTPPTHVKGEKHPGLKMARRHLQASIDALQKSAHDFAGHREKALDLEQKALAEIDMAMQSDKK